MTREEIDWLNSSYKKNTSISSSLWKQDRDAFLNDNKMTYYNYQEFVYYASILVDKLSDGSSISKANILSKLLSDGTFSVDNNFKFPSDITLDGVFGGCTNLKNIPETILPEVFSINNEGLFINCYNLELDITRIFDNVLYIGGNNGLSQMFDGCVKITGTAPIDKIKELMNYDGNRYFWMFRNCTNITNYAELVDNGMA